MHFLHSLISIKHWNWNIDSFESHPITYSPKTRHWNEARKKRGNNKLTLMRKQIFGRVAELTEKQRVIVATHVWSNAKKKTSLNYLYCDAVITIGPHCSNSRALAHVIVTKTKIMNIVWICLLSGFSGFHSAKRLTFLWAAEYYSNFMKTK